MSNLTKNIVMAAVLSMASAIKIEAGATVAGDAVKVLKRWQRGDVIFDRCDQSYYCPGGVYELRL